MIARNETKLHHAFSDQIANLLCVRFFNRFNGAIKPLFKDLEQNQRHHVGGEFFLPRIVGGAVNLAPQNQIVLQAFNKISDAEKNVNVFSDEIFGKIFKEKLV